MADASRIRLGVLTRPHGLKGGMRCLLDYPEIPTIATPCEVAIGFSESFNSPYQLTAYEPGRGEIVCSFRGIDDRDRALVLADQALFIASDKVSYPTPIADPGLIGCEVRNREGKLLGNIVGIFQTPAHYIWRVEEGEREWMLPAIDEFVLEIDEEGRRVTVQVIPGLYDDDLEVAPDGE